MKILVMILALAMAAIVTALPPAIPAINRGVNLDPDNGGTACVECPCDGFYGKCTCVAWGCCCSARRKYSAPPSINDKSAIKSSKLMASRCSVASLAQTRPNSALESA
ncbi:hypothetical protein P154DRAFT_575529 [Amniculicola lignicola CBS 123094]|uniref:Uncharacterized protein n=1 Tax=Amniculicola lignicola CBS 123094 TaxID=1392246 RepID=A0A6A5WIG9_9PLEO|nr:hypothetical protein P154DRAFT_575529 [Amniculicola lignicola CBS 123094]